MPDPVCVTSSVWLHQICRDVCIDTRNGKTPGLAGYVPVLQMVGRARGLTEWYAGSTLLGIVTSLFVAKESISRSAVSWV